MKRSEIKISNTELIDYLKIEQLKKMKVLGEQVTNQKINAWQANKEVLKVVQLKELVEAIDLKKLSVAALIKLINEIPDSRQAIQSKMKLF